MKKDEIKKRINTYFESRYGQVLDKGRNPVYDADGNPVYEIVRPPTLSGLALAIGLESREELMTFTSNKSIMREIHKAILRVEEYAEERLFSKDSNTAGIKLYLAVNFKRWSGEVLEGDDELPEEYCSWAE